MIDVAQAMTVAAAVADDRPLTRAAPRSTWVLGDLRTGRVQATAPVLPGSRCVTSHNQPGQMTAVMPLGDGAVRKVVPWVSAAPVAAFLALDVDGALIEAGPVWAHAWDEASQRLTLNAAGIWTVLDHRLLVPVGPSGAITTAVTTITKASLAAIGRGVIALSLSQPGGSLPIVLPPDEPGTARTRTWPAIDLPNVGTELRNLTRVEDGPDMAFRPRYVQADPTRVEWVFTAATPLVQDGADWVWDLGLPDGPVLSLRVTVDGQGLVNRAWGVGAGVGASMLISRYGFADGSGPYTLLEAVDQRKTVTVPATLDAHTARRLSDRPTMTVSVEVAASDAQAAAARPGDWAQLKVPKGHPYLPAGTYRCRISQITRTDADTIAVSMTPMELP